jgi:very-short-patch-repair endonuclease
MKLDHTARELCRKLRRTQTQAETIFWEHVRGRKFKELKFYRQCPIFYEINNQESFFIADFFWGGNDLTPGPSPGRRGE